MWDCLETCTRTQKLTFSRSMKHTVSAHGVTIFVHRSKRFVEPCKYCLENKNVLKLRVPVAVKHPLHRLTESWFATYVQLGLFKRLFPNIPLIAVTATATQRILNDVQTVLGLRKPKKLVASRFRSNLFFSIRFKVRVAFHCGNCALFASCCYSAS